MDDTRDPQLPDGPDAPRDPAADATVTPADRAADEHAVARVRDADPAAGTAPDLARLEARLADATGVTFGAAAGDELAAARARRGGRARWLQVAAVAAGAVLVGGGGYAVGASGADEPAAPPIALQGAAGSAMADAPMGAQEMAGAADARSMMAPGWFGGRTVFSGSGLPGAAGTAQAWAFDATSAATAEAAARAAQVLGVDGEPRQEWGQWIVGTNDGTSPSVAVGVDGQASMWFYDRAWDPSVCGATGGGASAEPGSADGEMSTMVEPGMPAEPAPADPSVCDPSSTPTGDAAIATARDLVADLGVDPAGYEFTVSDDTGVPGLVSVTGAQVVDGTQTGVIWSVQLAGTGVQSASGPLASLVDLGTYDVISADEAVERLNDPRFGASYGGVVPLAARAEATDAVAPDVAVVEPTDAPTVPSVPAAGSPLAWPVQDVTLTDARIGVTQLTTPTGATLLVPAWELSDADGGTWSVVAVAEGQLDLTAAG